MKKIVTVFVAVILATSFNSCKKTTTEVNAALCSNGIKDGLETEIDCGGSPCSPCPPASTFTCVITGGLPIPGGEQNISTTNAYGQILGPSIRISSGTTGNPFLFMFIPGDIGQSKYVSSVSFSYAGEPYTIDDTSTTGGVIVTDIDTLRRIISGTFSFRAERITNGNQKCYVHDGVFTNVRYREL